MKRLLALIFSCILIFSLSAVIFGAVTEEAISEETITDQLSKKDEAELQNVGILDDSLADTGGPMEVVGIRIIKVPEKVFTEPFDLSNAGDRITDYLSSTSVACNMKGAVIEISRMNGQKDTYEFGSNAEPGSDSVEICYDIWGSPYLPGVYYAKYNGNSIFVHDTGNYKATVEMFAGNPDKLIGASFTANNTSIDPDEPKQEETKNTQEEKETEKPEEKSTKDETPIVKATPDSSATNNNSAKSNGQAIQTGSNTIIISIILLIAIVTGSLIIWLKKGKAE